MTLPQISPILPGSPIAWIGLGTMGSPMAQRLAQAGYPVSGFNRTSHERLSSLPVSLASTPAEAIRECRLIIIMVRDAKSTRSLFEDPGGILGALSPGQILVNMSTESPEEAKGEAAWCAQKGVLYFDIPVSGSVIPAQKGELLLLGGGEEAHRPLIAGPMAILGKGLHWFGPAGSGMAAKLAINLLLAAHMKALAETLLVGEDLGLDPKELGAALLDSPLATPFYRIKIPALLRSDYTKAFSSSLMKKDLDLLLSELLSSGKFLPETLTATQALYHRIVAGGAGEKDLSILFSRLKSDSQGR